jgi:hypothetical protein
MTPETADMAVTRAQVRFWRALTNILVYIVVLNLFVEYVHTVVIDSFTVSILTAILLWLMLGAIMRIEYRLRGFFERREGWPFRVLRYFSVWAILFLSKFVILDVVALATAGRATLGQFLEVIAITLSLIAAEFVLGWIYRRLGGPSVLPRSERPS